MLACPPGLVVRLSISFLQRKKTKRHTPALLVQPSLELESVCVGGKERKKEEKKDKGGVTTLYRKSFFNNTQFDMRFTLFFIAVATLVAMALAGTPTLQYASMYPPAKIYKYPTQSLFWKTTTTRRRRRRRLRETTTITFSLRKAEFCFPNELRRIKFHPAKIFFLFFTQKKNIPLHKG